MIEFINYDMQDLRFSQQCYWSSLLLGCYAASAGNWWFTNWWRV